MSSQPEHYSNPIPLAGFQGFLRICLMVANYLTRTWILESQQYPTQRRRFTTLADNAAHSVVHSTLVGLPTFDEVIQARQYAINYQPMSLPTQVHQQCGAAMDLMMTETSSKSTALHDVPFQLSRDLEMRVNWETYLFHVPALPPTDNSGYEYDFTCEKAVMQETTSEEMRSGTFQEWTDNRCPPSQNITDSISNSIQTRQDPYSAPDLISFE
ncbi:uncharacterized protein LOC144359183 [Saccoglossus kowalevskii]